MEYFNFSKKERAGIYALLAIILLFIVIPFVLPFFVPQETYDPKDFKASIARLTAKKYDSSANNEEVLKKINTDYAGIELFYFDPNTLSAEGWKKLGVKDKTIATIQNYLSKGGKFYKPDDISKIWGLSKNEADRLTPYVKITQAAKEPGKYYTKDNNGNAHTLYKESKQASDINIADTSAFIALPGIASKLANRIVEFRNKLGGFYSIEQVGETFGLRDSVFQLIKPRLTISNTIPIQFNINTATVDQMKIHPYIHFAIANAIVQYRTQHGNYTNVTDIKKIISITNDAYNKMAPYLKVTE
ncbi:MAG TPA: helix-hairpin-helix domain-containing protein [Ferruginibacter sp.]|nr:helix-hairpin-helix domain-containing protein [Ferruginibacter sp.]